MIDAGVPIPPPYDDPANWPFRWCSYDEARGFTLRIQVEGPREGKGVAEEYGVHRRTISRAVRWFCLSTQQYDPETYFAGVRRRKAETRKWWRDKMDARDQETKRVNAEVAQARAALLEQRLAAEEAEARAPHIAHSYSDDSARRERRRELQRKLNERNRRRAS
jgi:hypothetical protein